MYIPYILNIIEYTASDFAREFAGQAVEDMRVLKSIIKTSGRKVNFIEPS